MVFSLIYDRWQLSKGLQLLHHAELKLGEGEGALRNFESVELYRKALKIYDWSHALDIGLATGMTD
eukprot:CAMPEP_0185787218 /NCGR_PEP_ID=MMETSP1174-20130828/139388_1 /TAXON_ID=35687 /ORGANISM="Dictyocha speculum, Strain CCMP1381" /LENGTH=65 /DNA_ID=CAMNT_0028480253 /DNA_START=100 /DNA_END=294 /DNA_ORIENTATION=-